MSKSLVSYSVTRIKLERVNASPVQLPVHKQQTASDYCNSGKKFFAYDYRNPNQDNVPVISTSTDIWFKAGEFGSTINTTGSMAKFQTTIFKPMKIDLVTQIVSPKTILATDIICEYP